MPHIIVIYRLIYNAAILDALPWSLGQIRMDNL